MLVHSNPFPFPPAKANKSRAPVPALAHPRIKAAALQMDIRSCTRCGDESLGKTGQDEDEFLCVECEGKGAKSKKEKKKSGEPKP
eukprot:387727-Rhodomonas_salina.3